MNREIKFRVWDNQFKQFRPDWFGDSLISLNGMFNDNGGRYVFQQFTSLKDKNNNEIHEGDICRRLANHDDYSVGGVLGEIKFIDGCFVFTEKERTVLLGDFITCHNVTCLEVIGNIFENPELISA